MLGTRLGQFRLVAIVEGWSFLLLLGIAMPLKYVWLEPRPVQVLGMAHGVLFVLYILGIVLYRTTLRWNFLQAMIAAALSLVPFGTFYVTGAMMPKQEG